MSARSVGSIVKEHLVISPETSLNRTQEEVVLGDLSSSYSSYGHAYLFVRFLERNFNAPLAQIILGAPEKDGILTLKHLLLELGTTLEEQFLKFSIAKYINRPDYLLNLDERSQPNLVAREFKTKLQPAPICPEGLNVACLLKTMPAGLAPSERIEVFQVDGAGHPNFCKTGGDCDPRLGSPLYLLVRTHF